MKFIRKTNDKLKKEMKLDFFAVILFAFLAIFTGFIPTTTRYFTQIFVILAIIFYYIDYRFNEVILEIRK